MNARSGYLISSVGHAGVLALGFALSSLVRTPPFVPGVKIVLGGAGARPGAGSKAVTPFPAPPQPVKPEPKIEPEPPKPSPKKVEESAPPERTAAKPPEKHGTKPPKDPGIVSKAKSAKTTPPAAAAASNPGPATGGGQAAAGTGPGKGGRGEVGVEAEGEAGPAAGYLARLRELVVEAWEPPATSERAGEARVVVVFTVMKAGGMPVDVSVLTSSGMSLFDRRALAAIADAAPLPPMPAHLGYPSIVIRFTFTQQY